MPISNGRPTPARRVRPATEELAWPPYLTIHRRTRTASHQAGFFLRLTVASRGRSRLTITDAAEARAKFLFCIVWAQPRIMEFK